MARGAAWLWLSGRTEIGLYAAFIPVCFIGIGSELKMHVVVWRELSGPGFFYLTCDPAAAAVCRRLRVLQSRAGVPSQALACLATAPPLSTTKQDGGCEGSRKGQTRCTWRAGPGPVIDRILRLL
jgi:hypothetical protein